MFNIPPTAKVMEARPQLRISSEGLEKPGIELGTPGYKKIGYPLHHGGS